MVVAATCLYSTAQYFPPERADHFWLYRHPLPRLGDFMLGMLAAQWCRLNLEAAKAPRPLIWSALAYCSIGFALWLMQDPVLFSTSFSWDVAYAIPSVTLIVGLTLAQRSFVARLLSQPWLVLLGEASYALYLCQFLAGFALLSYPFFQRGSALTGGIWLFLVVFCSILLHVLIERPSRRLIMALFRLAVQSQEKSNGMRDGTEALPGAHAALDNKQ
jgi:peptidoglycan/LPS O-acetylase OafA/YrhL